MPAALLEVKGSQVKIELTVELDRSMLETEERIQDASNEAGCIASREAVGYFDTDVSPIRIGPEIWRTKGRQPKCYPTPYGEVEVARATSIDARGADDFTVRGHTHPFVKEGWGEFSAGIGPEIPPDLPLSKGD